MDRRDVIKGQRELERKLYSVNSNTVKSNSSTNPNVDRRHFLRYLVALGLVGAAGAVGAGYYFNNPNPNPPSGTPTTSPNEPSTTKTNHAPTIEKFEIKPKYFCPTNEQFITLINESYDPDNDPLTTTWLVDGKEVGHGTNSTVQSEDGRNLIRNEYKTKLSEGKHLINPPVVSDGIAKAPESEKWYGRPITVEPDQIYPVKPLRTRYKGITYYVGPISPDWMALPDPNHEQIVEQLETIHNELGCNAIIISGGEGYEEKLIECGQVAIEKGFERIHVQPRYPGVSPDEMVEKIRKFASKMRELRQASDAVIYSFGHELGLETAIISGDSVAERTKTFLNHYPGDLQKMRADLQKMFKDILTICEENYGHTLSYAAIAYLETDIVPWEDPAFESVGVDAILEEGLGCDESWVLELLSSLKKYNKPIQSMEAGCMTFTGAGKVAGTAPLHTQETLNYDEDEQANWIKRYCDLLNTARIDGYFYTQYNDSWNMGYDLYNGTNRKKGFYMYKSYQRSPS